VTHHQHQKHHGVERPDFPHHLLDGDLADRASNEKDRPNRRVTQPDAKVEQHDHAEVNRIDAEILHHTGSRIGVAISMDGAMSTRVPSTQQQDVDQKQDDVLLSDIDRKNAVIFAGICVSAMM